MPSFEDDKVVSWQPSRTAGLAWAAVTVAIFAGWFVVTRFAVTRTLTVWDIMALRFGIGAAILLPVLRGRLPAGAWRNGFWFSLLWGAPFVLCVAQGIKLTSVAQGAAVAPTMMPVFAGLLGWLLLGQHPGPLRLAGYAAILAGIATFLAASGAGLSGASLLGLGALALGAAMWAGYTLIFPGTGLSALQSGALICLWSSALFLPVYVLAGLSHLGQAAPGELAFQALYQGVLMSGIAIIAFNRAVAMLGPAAASAIVAMVPVAATLLAVPALGERPATGEFVAILCVATGVLLATRPSRPARSKSYP